MCPAAFCLATRFGFLGKLNPPLVCPKIKRKLRLFVLYQEQQQKKKLNQTPQEGDPGVQRASDKDNVQLK